MPRALALELLDAVLRRRQPLDDAFEAHPRTAELEPRDRAFARNLAATTLRRLGQIDALIAHGLEHPLSKKGNVAQDILRLGVCQLVFLETPAHAAVDTSVALADRARQGPYKKLINAVLRRLATEGAAIAQGQDAARLNTPDWLWRSWSAAYTDDTCRRIARSHLTEAPLDLTVKADPENWAERLGARILPSGTLRLDNAGPIADLPGYGDGAWWVQDCAAALPARLLGEVAGKRVIDLCAAPGGKTAQLAAAGAIVTALDRSEKRLARLSENLARLGLSAEIVAADATTWRPDRPADAVLLDAPCTATGTIRRHPDIARLRAPADVAKLSALQARLLESAAEMVAPGGVLVYAVCSLQPEEGPELVEKFLATGDMGLKPVAPDERYGLDDVITVRGTLRTLPFHLGDSGGMDGFFAARFTRA